MLSDNLKSRLLTEVCPIDVVCATLHTLPTLLLWPPLLSVSDDRGRRTFHIYSKKVISFHSYVFFCFLLTFFLLLKIEVTFSYFSVPFVFTFSADLNFPDNPIVSLALLENFIRSCCFD